MAANAHGEQSWRECHGSTQPEENYDEGKPPWQSVHGNEKPHGGARLINVHLATDKDPWKRTGDDNWHGSATPMVMPIRGQRPTTEREDNHGGRGSMAACAGVVEMHEVEQAQPQRHDNRGVSLEKNHAQAMPSWETVPVLVRLVKTLDVAE